MLDAPRPMDKFGSRDHAQQLLRYFTNIQNQYPRQEFVDGAVCAREWLALLDDEYPDSNRVRALVERVAAYSDGGSGWLDLQLGVNRWANKT